MTSATSRSSIGGADPEVDSRIVKSIQFWMRAYPRRWREARGEELVDLVVDLAGPDARRLDARAAFDLVQGGLATRWREQPPPHTLLLYRMIDRRIPAAYRSWALDDIDGFWYPMRRYLANLWWFPLVLVATQPGPSGVWPVWFFAVIALGSAASMSMWPEQMRCRSRLKHLAPRFGEQPVESTLVAWNVPRERVAARSVQTWAVLFLAVTGAASVVAAVLAPKVIQVIPIPGGAEFGVAPVGGRWVVAVAILAMALGLGVLGGSVARRRLNRLLAERPDQPYRVLGALSATGKVNVLFWSMIIAALAWLEVSGRTVLGLSVVLGTVALLLLPGALVALVATRGGAPDLAGRDVWWVATRGRVPTVDRPVPAITAAARSRHRRRPGPAAGPGRPPDPSRP
jgi:hypothetical protein